MPTSITIDSSGRLVIPKPIRERLCLSPGTQLTLIEEDEGRLVLIPEVSDAVAVEHGGILIFRGRWVGEIPDHRAIREERLESLSR